MLPPDDEVLTCPSCQTLVCLPGFMYMATWAAIGGRLNMVGAKHGGKIDRTICAGLRRLTRQSPIARCPLCHHVFWTNDATKIGEIELDFYYMDNPSANPTLPEWKNAPELQDAEVQDLEVLLEMEQTSERRRFILLRLWSHYLEEWQQSHDEFASITGRLEQLNLALLDEFPGNDDYSVLLRADVSRQLGEFDRAAHLANSVAPDFRWIGCQIANLAAQMKTGNGNLKPLAEVEAGWIRDELALIPVAENMRLSSNCVSKFKEKIPWENLRGGIVELQTGKRLQIHFIELRSWPDGPLLHLFSNPDKSCNPSSVDTSLFVTYSISSFSNETFRCLYPPLLVSEECAALLATYASRFRSQESLFLDDLDTYEKQSVMTLAQGARQPSTGLELHFLKVLDGTAIPASPLENLWYKEVRGEYFEGYITRNALENNKQQMDRQYEAPSESDWEKASRFERNQNAVSGAREYMNHKGNVPNVLNVPRNWLVTYSGIDGQD